MTRPSRRGSLAMKNCSSTSNLPPSSDHSHRPAYAWNCLILAAASCSVGGYPATTGRLPTTLISVKCLRVKTTKPSAFRTAIVVFLKGTTSSSSESDSICQNPSQGLAISCVLACLAAHLIAYTSFTKSMFNGECKLATIWLFSKDTKTAGEYYREVLKMKQTEHGETNSFDGGGLRLSIHPDGHDIYLWQPPSRSFTKFKNVSGIVQHYEKVLSKLEQ